MDGDVAVVTGAGRGIGLEVCRQLVDRGMTVVLTARDPQKGVLAAEGIGAAFQPVDVTDPSAVRLLVDAVARAYKRIDVLINNAAAYADWAETPSRTDIDSANRVLLTNLLAPWNLIQAFLPLMTRPGARIVNVSSGGGSHEDGNFGLRTNRGAPASYGVSKAALNALTAAFAAELSDRGVLVNAVCPGLTATAPGMEAMGARPVVDGAASVVWAATLPPDGPTGGFFRDGQAIDW